MASLGIAFQLSASATGMAQGINAGVVELQKLGYAAKQTARDVSALKTLEISRAFISGISTIANTFQAFTSGALNAIDNTRQLAQSLGVSYNELRNLQVAADLSGASSEQLAKAFTRAQVTISNAASGSKEAQSALSALGLSVEGLATQTTTQQFASIASAINAIDNPAQRAAAAVAIFGRSGAELLPTFRELPENLRTAQTFLGGFRDGINGVDPEKIDAIGDSFGLAGQAMQELAGRVLTQLQPALTQASDNFIKFIQGIDVPAAAATLSKALGDIASTLALVGQFAAPLASRLLPSIGAYLAFINRQAIGGAITGLASAFAASARAALGYSVAAGTAATATVGLGVAIRSLLASTGIGLLVVGLGLAAGALVEWSIAGGQAGTDTEAAVASAEAAMERFRRETENAGVAAFNLGEEVKGALKVPEEISIREFAQGSLDEARSAIVNLAKELGGLDQVPREVSERFAEISNYAGQITEQSLNQGAAIGFVDKNSRALIETIRQITEARKTEADAARQAADAANKAAEESRKRVSELSTQGLSGAEQSRLQLNKDLLAIALEQKSAEAALIAARAAGDNAAIDAAKQRLDLALQATETAKQQDRRRQLEALGIDDSLVKPAKTIGDELQAIKTAFNQNLLDPQEALQALRTVVAEGINIRREIAAELSRPAEQSLRVSDLRTQEGISAYVSLVTNRQDPAIEQRRQQLQKLDEIKRELANVVNNPVDILGG